MEYSVDTAQEVLDSQLLEENIIPLLQIALIWGIGTIADEIESLARKVRESVRNRRPIDIVEIIAGYEIVCQEQCLLAWSDNGD